MSDYRGKSFFLTFLTGTAKGACSITPAKATFGPVVALLTMIKVCSLLFFDYGAPSSRLSGSRWSKNRVVSTSGSPAPMYVCKALARGLKVRRSDKFSQSVLEAIQHDWPTGLSIAEWQESRDIVGGSWTPAGSFTSSMYVRSVLPDDC